VLVLALAGILALSGCVNGQAFPILTKTETIADELRELPGVSDVVTAAIEETRYSPATSEVYATVASELTAQQIQTILTTFAASNERTGTDIISTSLALTTGVAATSLHVEYEGLTDDLAAALAEQWVLLRGAFEQASLGVVPGQSDDYVVNLEVVLGGDQTFDRDAGALVAVRSTFDALGAVGTFTETNGAFAAEGGLPNDASLALLYSIDTAAESLTGTFFSASNSYGLVASTPSPEAVVNAVPPVAGTSVYITFDGTELFFDTADCLSYEQLDSSDPSALLLNYWARDGRTLRDGSAAASCFA
jgi:hypothetical protein